MRTTSTNFQPLWRSLVAFVVVGLSLPGFAAQSSTRWGVVSAEGQGDSSHLRALQLLLQDELLRRGIEPVALVPTCRETRCAFEAAQAVSAEALVKLEVLQLGEKVLARAELWSVAPIRLERAERVQARSVEELDSAAPRLAEALVATRAEPHVSPPVVPAPPAPAPAPPPAAYVRPPESHTLERAPEEAERGGASLMAVGIVPSKPDDRDETGVGVNLGYWFETRHLAIEPRVGFHVHADDVRTREVPLEVGAYWLPLDGDVTPFFGVAAGLHYRSENVYERVRVGSVLVSESAYKDREVAWGLGATARAGLILLRTHRLRVAGSIEYGTSFLEITGHRNPQSFRMGVGVLF